MNKTRFRPGECWLRNVDPHSHACGEASSFRDNTLGAMTLPRLLIVDGAPGPYIDLIRARWRGEIAIAKTVEELEETIFSFEPHVAFVYKVAGLGPESTENLVKSRQLGWIHLASVGVDHIAGWQGEKITVTNSAGILSAGNAEYAIAAILAVNSNLLLYGQQQREAIWRPQPWTGLAGKTLIQIGVGAIGGRIAKLAKAHGMRVVGVRFSARSHPDLDEVFEISSLPDIIERADFVALSAPLTDHTRGLFNRKLFARMKPGASLINLSRGALVDEDALVEALSQGRLKAAVLDVFQTEPLPAGSILWRTPGVIVTPHISGSVSDWREKVALGFLQNLKKFEAGEQLHNIVDPERRY